MSHFSPQDQAADWYLAGPFKLVYCGLAVGALALLLRVPDGVFFAFLRSVLMVAGMLAAGGAIWWRLSTADANDFEEQSKTGILMALASGCVLFGYVVLPESWDSLRMVLLVMWVVTLVAVPLLLLPRLIRRVIVSLLVVFHFGGILTATTAVQLPNNAPLPWLPTMIWNHVYRHYLTFTYLNNAYHFYSPEPGPPTLVWFQVIFDDGTTDKPASTYWHRIVRREDYPTRQQYQRMLSLTESLNQPTMVSPSKFAILTARRGYLAGPQPPRPKDGSPPLPSIRIPEEVPIQDQYREPGELAKRYLQSYAAYVCRTTKHPTKPEAQVKSVRVYRLTHLLINAAQMSSKLKPTDPTLFWAFFYGEYDYKPWLKEENKPVVELKGSPYEEERPTLTWMEPTPAGTFRQVEEPVRDPMLYWLLPIYRKPKREGEFGTRIEDYDLIDTLSVHSRDRIKWDE